MQKEKESAAPHGDEEQPMVYEMKDVQLPRDVSRWRTVHVLAWLTCELNLPQYIDTFNEASIDGLLLLDHLNYDMLKNFMNIDNPVHQTKIIIGRENLKIRYENYKKLLAQKQKEKEEAERRRKEREAEEERLRLEKLKKKNGKNKKVPMKTMSKPDFIDNGINRYKLETILKQEKEKQQTLKKKKLNEFNRLNKTWQFEYNGNLAPNLEDMYQQANQNVWNTIANFHDNKNPAVGTKNYQKTMKSMITSDEITNIPLNREVRDVPKTCSTDDVVAIIKGAMFEVSNWLLKLEELNYQKQFLLDYDLLEDPDEFQFDELDTESEAIGGESIPPTYSHYLSESESIPNLPAVPTESKNNDKKAAAGESEKKGIAELKTGGAVDEGDDDLPPPSYDDILKSPDKETTKPAAVTVSVDKPKTDKKAENEGNDELNLSSPLPNEKSQLSVTVPPHSPAPERKPSTSSKKKKDLTHSLQQSKALLTSYDPNNPPFETNRMKLIFKSFIDQTNNHANWLGPNGKLTRLKLEGGIENILKLRLAWEQFDMLWNRLDYKRSGDIDFNEFEKFFGNLNEFLSHEGMNNMSLTASQKVNALTGNNNTYYMTGGGQPGTATAIGMAGGVGNAEMKQLIDYLYQFCDVLRKTSHFTVIEMFQSFDRNGSGDVSLSEFCSLLRLVISAGSPEGNLAFDKKMIYKALNVLDVDGNKSISLHELLLFIYRIWKTQLNDLGTEISLLTRSASEETNKKNNAKRNELIQKYYQEREEIKNAIKRNYPRQWRDKFEKEGSNIPGPFSNLLNQLNIHTVDTFQNPQFDETNNPLFSPEKPSSLTKARSTSSNNTSSRSKFYETSSDKERTQPPPSSDHEDAGYESGGHSRQHPPEDLYVEENDIPLQHTLSPTRRNNNKTFLSTSSPSKKPGRTYLQGHNTLLRFKIKVPASIPPYRTATHHHQPMKLTVPTAKTISNADIMSGEATNKVLHEFDYLAGTYN